MEPILTDILLSTMAFYLLFGVLFSVYFYAKAGIRIDEGVKDTPWHFKLIIFPGVVLFWVVLLRKFLKSND